jgi:hypothetical protein
VVDLCFGKQKEGMFVIYCTVLLLRKATTSAISNAGQVLHSEASRFFLGRLDGIRQVHTYVIGLLSKTDVLTYLYNINASRILTG